MGEVDRSFESGAHPRAGRELCANCRAQGASCGLRISLCVPISEGIHAQLYIAAASNQPSWIAPAGPLAVNHDPVWSLCPLTGAGAQEKAHSAWVTHLGGEIVLL